MPGRDASRSRPVPATTGPTTLVANGVVLVTGPEGEVDPSTTQGLFHRDVRVVSRLAWEVDGRTPQLLSAARVGAARADVGAAVRDDRGEVTGLALRTTSLDTRLSERMVLQVAEGRVREVSLALESDLVGLHKHMRPGPPGFLRAGLEDGTWTTLEEGSGVEVRVEGPRPKLRDDRLCWDVDLGPGDELDVVVHVQPMWHGTPPVVASEVPLVVPVVEDGPRGLAPAVASAGEDLAALLVRWPEQDARYLAAGAPWFMAVFGRDMLLTAWMALVADPGVALDVLELLARFQGTDGGTRPLEEPGRILHELRTGGHDPFGTAGEPYYGTADATPLFVVLLDEAHRFGADPRRVAALLPAARAAVAWCRDHGDLAGNGFVSHRADPDGIHVQSWKDSGDSMVHADGRLATDPVAPCEVQAYLHGALVGLARLEERLGEPARAEPLREEAAALQRRFRAAFWLPGDGIVAMAVDGDGRPLAVPSSNMGHCLWTGLLDDDVAAAVVAALEAPGLASPWGVRTLGTDAVPYHPFSYHRGSVWPHDSAIVAAGMARAGHRDAAAALCRRLLDACEAFGWRLPELLSGIGTDDVAQPVPYPVACSPQAWSAAVPLALTRVLLGLEPDVPTGRVRLAPATVEPVRVAGVALGRHRVEIRASASSATVEPLPRGLVLDTV